MTLGGVKLPRGIDKIPTWAEINGTATLHYHHLALTQTFDFIIGHIPYMANGTLNLKDYCKSLGTLSKAILFVHSLPRTRENDIHEEVLLEWLKDAEVVFSIGENVKSDIDLYIKCLKETERPVHKMYVPRCPADLLTIMQEERASPI